MTTIASGLDTQNRLCFCSCQSAVYASNNFNPVKVWDGLSSTMQDAGMDGPTTVLGSPTSTAAGGFDNGAHLLRYRYKNSRTKYVSNPSDALTYTVTGGNGLLTFNIAAAAQPILTSADAKCDTIIVEATRTGGGAYYLAGSAPNATGSIQVGMNDNALSQQFNIDAAYGGDQTGDTFSNDKPPLGTICIPYRGRMWIMGDAAYPLTGVTFTNGSTAVTGTGFNTLWAGYIITKAGDTTGYEIASVTNSTNLVLARAYAGSTSTTTATVTSATPNRGYYSRLYYPEQFFPTAWAREFLAEQSDQVRAAVGRKDGLYVLGLTSAERLIFNADPSAAAGATLSPLKGKRGAWHQRVVIEVEGEIYSWDRQGMWRVAEVPEHISEPVERILEDYVDFDESAQFHTAFDPSSRILMFFYVAAGDTTPKYASCMEIDTGRWFLVQFQQGITASNIVPTTDGEVRLMLGDENGFSWYYGINGSFDGPPANSPTVVTVTGSPSTTVIPVTETLPTVAPTLEGVMCYNPVTTETKYIDSNTANQITLGSAYSAAPTVGQELWLGCIPFEYVSKWWIGPGQALRKNPLFLSLRLFPGSTTGTARIYFYADFSTVPSSVTAFPADTMPAGVTVPSTTQTYLEVALSGGNESGSLMIPVPIEWQKAFQVRVTSLRPDGALRILDLDLVEAAKPIADAD